MIEWKFTAVTPPWAEIVQLLQTKHMAKHIHTSSLHAELVKWALHGDMLEDLSEASVIAEYDDLPA